MILMYLYKPPPFLFHVVHQFIGLKKRLIVTCKNATDTMTLIWHVQLADSISVALVISKDSVNTNTKKIIQVNLILYKALFLSKFLR